MFELTVVSYKDVPRCMAINLIHGARNLTVRDVIKFYFLMSHQIVADNHKILSLNIINLFPTFKSLAIHA